MSAFSRSFTSDNVLPYTVGSNRGINVRSDHSVEDVEDGDRLSLGWVVLLLWLDLESFLHELLYLLVDRCLAGLILVVVDAPTVEVLNQLLLNIVHVKSRAAESQSWERNVFHKLGRVLKDCHNLNISL